MFNLLVYLIIFIPIFTSLMEMIQGLKQHPHQEQKIQTENI